MKVNKKKCPTCRGIFELGVFDTNKMYCSEECHRGYKAKEAKRKRMGRRIAVFARDNFKCVLCGQDMTQTDGPFTLDHVVPISEGGSNKLCNLITCCLRCNSSKCGVLLHKDTLRSLLLGVKERNKKHGLDPSVRIAFKGRK